MHVQTCEFQHSLILRLPSPLSPYCYVSLSSLRASPLIARLIVRLSSLRVSSYCSSPFRRDGKKDKYVVKGR